MITIVCKYNNETAFLNRLKALGLIIRDPTGEFGNVVVENIIEAVNTPPLEDISGDFLVTFRCSVAQANKLPPDNNPAFSIVWRSDVFQEDESLFDWPLATVQTYDIDGNPNDTNLQGVGTIA